MDRILIEGGVQLSGEISISGAKNACLALMPAALLTRQPLTLTNTPFLSDINTMRELLASLGCEVAGLQNNRIITIAADKISNHIAKYDIVRKMRASILVLGPLVAREGKAVVSLPGGCAIGARPVDIHLSALQAMGADLELKEGYIFAEATRGLQAVDYTFPVVSVGATENIVMAATLAKGKTILRNCALEPEIKDLCVCLVGMGAKIQGAGTPTITIDGVSELTGNTHSVIVDRIELGTYMLAPAISGGEVFLRGGRIDLVESFSKMLSKTGANVTALDEGVLVKGSTDGILPVNISTEPYPGFPTDLQAQMMALLTLSQGTSKLEENIFENRFMHAPELARMGANISVEGGTAQVVGVASLKGAPVMATDLRASISLILAALAARGQTVISRVYHLDRGYENVTSKLSACGAKIKRISS
ncbi:MAG: UDP-N-acetylglucosamine 1-carboxyvinyltransferase [Rhodobacteraceae bacterium]|nr:MAG: UDP-N-acetylglucosamine 1-carboxyvinyltransferase [Paracoccaceae bacterium]